jgi:hypothetical protein
MDPPSEPDPFLALEAAVAGPRHKVLVHPIYRDLNCVEHLQRFMEVHVFAVWDFMSLLKSLQISLTCVDIAWRPVGDSTTRRLINEIVLGEETDEVRPGQYRSHLELYIEAMEEVGADSRSIRGFLEDLSFGMDPEVALDRATVPECVRAFSGWTWRLATQAPPYEVAAAFLFGREDLVPDMFRKVLTQLGEEAPALGLYLERHIELDEGQHGPMARDLLRSLCGDVHGHWIDARNAAVHSLNLRKALWDGVVEQTATNSA